MATFTNGAGHIYTFPDDKPDFTSWLAVDPARKTAWDQAVVEYSQYQQTNGSDPTDSNCDKIFAEWKELVGAKRQETA